MNKNKNVIRWFLAFFLVFFLGVVAFASSINFVYAASVTTGVSGLTADSSGNATWTYSSGTINGSVTASSSTSCGNTTYSSRNGTLTFTNNSGATALLSFDYGLTLAGGSATIDDVSVTSGRTFNKTLASAGTVVIKITSNAINDTATTIAISNMQLTSQQEITVTFKTATNGSYTVDGNSITSQTSNTYLTTDSISLAATPASGYKLFGWYNQTTGSYFNFSASCTASFTQSCTIYPTFVESGYTIWQVGTNCYTDLSDAISYANSSGNSTIVLISSGTLNAGNYTIANGKTLLVPFDEGKTVYTTTPAVVYAAREAPSPYITLTMESGAHITIQNGGTMSVPSKLCAYGQNSSSNNGTPTGKHGRVQMKNDSTITLNSGAVLSCFGYIAGSGQVIAQSGSTVWEAFQLRCWRGGTATSNMAGNSQKVFPMNQYYLQNIEVELFLYSGALEKVYTAVNMSNSAYTASATFIGTGTGSFFRITSGYVVKKYEGSTDRLIFDIHGNVSLAEFSLKIAGLPLIGTINLDTGDYVMPINSNITINVLSGTTTVSQELALLPGTILTVAKDAIVTINSNVYVYDKDEWGEYACGAAQLVVCGYSTVNGTTAKRNANSLIDAIVDINGRVNNAGKLYTTTSGADIRSSEQTGELHFTSAAPSQGTTYQATQSGSTISYVGITVTSAQLKNGTLVEKARVKDSNDNIIELNIDDYTSTAGSTSGTVFQYYNFEEGHTEDYKYGWWSSENYTGAPIGPETYQIIYDFGNGKSFSVDYIESSGLPIDLPAYNDSRIADLNLSLDYTVKKWQTVDGSRTFDTNYTIPSSDPLVSSLAGDVTFVPFFGGWYCSDINSKYYYVEYDTNATPTYATGLWKVKDALDTMLVDANDFCYFGADNTYQSSYSDFLNYTSTNPNVPSGLYYINAGNVRKEQGIFDLNGNYYCVNSNRTLLVDGVYYMDTSMIGSYNGDIAEGYYRFESDGRMIISGKPATIENGIVYDSTDTSSRNQVYGYGLFKLNSDYYLYYCKQDGTIFTNGTLYVEKTNGYYISGIKEGEVVHIQPGLYYFDEYGHMYYGNELLQGTTAEYGPIMHGQNGAIIGGNN